MRLQLGSTVCVCVYLHVGNEHVRCKHTWGCGYCYTAGFLKQAGLNKQNYINIATFSLLMEEAI